MTAERPYVNPRPGADRYHAPGERIVEYSGRGGGGLIQLRTVTVEGEPRLHVVLYRHDATVDIAVGLPDGAGPSQRARDAALRLVQIAFDKLESDPQAPKERNVDDYLAAIADHIDGFTGRYLP